MLRSCCDKLGELADCCIREVTDPLLLQPASLDVATVRKKTEEELGKQSNQLITPVQGDDSFLPVCSVSCTVYLQLFTNIDVLYVRPESTYKQICSTLSV